VTLIRIEIENRLPRDSFATLALSACIRHYERSTSNRGRKSVRKAKRESGGASESGFM